jgi:hypothetical protein
MPKSLLKKPGASECVATLIVSFALKSLVIETSFRRDGAAVRRRVLECERRRPCGASRQDLRARERSRICGQLELALLAEPRPDVEHERRHPEQAHEEQDRQHHGLAVLSLDLHSTASVDLVVRVPELTTQPSKLIE